MRGAPLSSIPSAALVLPVFHLTSPSPQNVVEKKKKNAKYGVTKSHLSPQSEKYLTWKRSAKMMNVMKKGMGSECPLSFPGDEHEMSM